MALTGGVEGEIERRPKKGWRETPGREVISATAPEKQRPSHGRERAGGWGWSGECGEGSDCGSAAWETRVDEWEASEWERRVGTTASMLSRDKL